MGFMDKAKRMAEQAQQKLDETQNRFNQGQADETSGPGAGAVRYDEHGRQIPDDATEAQAEAGIPVAESIQAEPGTDPGGQSGETSEEAHKLIEGEPPEGVEQPGEGQPPAGRVEKSGAAGNAEGNETSSGGPNSSPDPFKPVE